MGVVGVAGVFLKADAVGIFVPLVAVAGDDVVGLNDDLGGVGDIFFQLRIDTGADLGNGVLTNEQGRHPLGGAGLDQGHGQHVPGGGGGSVEHHVHHQNQCRYRKDHHGKQHQEEPADDPAQQAAALFLLFRGRANALHGGHSFFAHSLFQPLLEFCGAKTQRCWIM